MGNLDCLSGQLVDLAKQHKNRGTTRAHFDVRIFFFLNVPNHINILKIIFD
jgi:hypothetical protein